MKKFIIVFFSLILLIALGIFVIQIDSESNVSDKIKVACVGDSITYRHGFEDAPENNYPYALANIIGEEYQVKNFGESGTCVQADGDCAYIEQRVYKESLKYEADILIFMLGTNDSKEWNWKDKESFRKSYETLLDTYEQKYSNAEIYIGISPKAFYVDGRISGTAEFGIEPDIVEQIVEIQLDVANERGYSTINIYELSELHPEWFAEDGIHPTKDGAKGIAETVADTIMINK